MVRRWSPRGSSRSSTRRSRPFWAFATRSCAIKPGVRAADRPGADCGDAQHRRRAEVLLDVHKRPERQAFTDLMNRAIDKPREQPHEVKVTGDDEMVRRLHAGRARAAALKGEA